MSRLIIKEILNEDSGQTLQSMMVRCLNGKQWFAAEDIISMHPNILDVSDIVARIVKFASGSLLEHAISYGVKLTPDLLDMAIEYNNQECAKILYDEGLRPTDLDASFINACKHGYSEMVEELIELGADITSNNSAGINLACQNNHDDVVKKLKKLGEAPSEMSLELAEDNRNYVSQKYYERRA
jgi:hypothetical protein